MSSARCAQKSVLTKTNKLTALHDVTKCPSRLVIQQTEFTRFPLQRFSPAFAAVCQTFHVFGRGQKNTRLLVVVTNLEEPFVTSQNDLISKSVCCLRGFTDRIETLVTFRRGLTFDLDCSFIHKSRRLECHRFEHLGNSRLPPSKRVLFPSSLAVSEYFFFFNLSVFF